MNIFVSSWSNTKMGNSSSKSTVIVQKTVKQAKQSSKIDEAFGQSIIKNVQLKETPINLNLQSTPHSSNLMKRMELNKQTAGTVSWQEFPLIFEPKNKLSIDKDKVEELKKYFYLPSKSE